MALINCPECKREISDKSNTCIHCGYPISLNQNQSYAEFFDIIVLNVADGFTKYSKLQKMIKEISQTIHVSFFDIKEHFFDEIDYTNRLKTCPFVAFTGLSEANAQLIGKIIRKYGAQIEILKSKVSEENFNEKDIKINDAINQTRILSCPRCGSTAITTGQKGFSIVTGFLGSNKTVNRCGKCGHSWQPK